MNAISTRGGVPPTPIAEAIARGIAADGGLFVPERLPRLAASALDAAGDLPAVAARLLRPFLADSELAAALPAMCHEALSFPVPLVALDDDSHVLELFHGPTAAFKDVGARFLAACLQRIGPADQPLRTVLVATSGDTGGAVADAFFARPGFRVVILYPDGRVAPRQAHLLSCYGGNVATFAVGGSFDDCQRMVKQAFADRRLGARLLLTSANSISLGRLLPQMAYYASTALDFARRGGERLNFVIPTGNLGNALACILAREIGLPIGDIALATNANRVLPDYFAGGDYAPATSVATLANAMDVGDPSNFERLRWWFEDDALRARIVADHVGDDEIRATITAFHARHGRAICPHTATAARILERRRDAGDRRPWCIVATAHPAKFETVVEPLVGHAIEPPAPLQQLLRQPAHAEPLAADYGALCDAL
ncbi:MAG: threonine synthase [Planctomycetes bacterium]|nr:threonine synthase [Planctomycetota bacterium]